MSALEAMRTFLLVKKMKEVAISLHPPSTLEVFKCPGLPTIDFCFIVFIFHSDVIPNEITVLQGCLIENLQLLSVSGSSPRRPPGLWARQAGDPVPSDTLTSRWKKKGRVLLAVSRSHHSLVTQLLWCPPVPPFPDGMSFTHGGKSISHV